MHTMTPNAATNAKKTDRLSQVWSELLAEALRRDFYGTVLLEVTIQDGVIQAFRRKVERTEK